MTKALHWEQTHPAYLVGITVQSVPSHILTNIQRLKEDGQPNMIIKNILVTLQIREKHYTIILYRDSFPAINSKLAAY